MNGTRARRATIGVRIALGCALVAVGLATRPDSSGAGTFAGQPGAIYFISTDGISAMRPDGSSRQVIVPSSFAVAGTTVRFDQPAHVSVSSDGTQLAFDAHLTGRPDVERYLLQTSLTKPAGVNFLRFPNQEMPIRGIAPSWDRSASSVSFSQPVPTDTLYGGGHLAIASASGVTQLNDGLARFFEITDTEFSPLGSAIAYIVAAPPAGTVPLLNQVRVAKVGSSAAHMVVASVSAFADRYNGISWRSDNRRLAYTSIGAQPRWRDIDDFGTPQAGTGTLFGARVGGESPAYAPSSSQGGEPQNTILLRNGSSAWILTAGDHAGSEVGPFAGFTGEVTWAIRLPTPPILPSLIQPIITQTLNLAQSVLGRLQPCQSTCSGTPPGTTPGPQAAGEPATVTPTEVVAPTEAIPPVEAATP